MTREWLEKNGFIKKHIFGDWYIVRLYTKGWRRLIMFPMKIKSDIKR